MPKRRTDHPGQIGAYWLERHGTEQWKRTWYDDAARQVRRASLGNDDFRDFATAQLALAEWVVGHRKLTNEPPASVPLELLLVKYWDGHAKAIPSAGAQKIALRYWSEHFAGKTVADVTRDALDGFIKALYAKGLSRGYVSRVLSVGRAALRRAWEYGELAAVPFVPDVETMAQRRGKAPRGRELNVPEMAALLGAAHAPHMAKWLMIAGNTLARPQAACDLGEFQVDRAHRRIDLNPTGRLQTKKHRGVVPITATLEPWLVREPEPPADKAKRRRRGKIENDRFVTYGGRPVKSVRRGFRAMRDEAGLDATVTPYSIRHTLGRALRRAKVPSEQIDFMLSHLPRGSAATTATYAPFDPDYCQEAVAAIDAYWAKVQAELFAGVLEQMALDAPPAAADQADNVTAIAGRRMGA